ncbi:unnamed protein product [Clonostachys solani]|uniref:Uncharacterized protein n=1 Tax=Clonostachys solani TaxID=160281 RepID=A0A9P0ETW0_9HYPO|nr:unnamed protein product [Clonostachys solani]
MPLVDSQTSSPGRDPAAAAPSPPPSSSSSPWTLSSPAPSESAIATGADLVLDSGGLAVVHLFHLVVVLGPAVGELEFPASAALGDVLALEGGDVGPHARALRLIDVHGVVLVVAVLAEDELAVEVVLGLGLGGFAHLDGLGRGDVGEGLLVEKVEGLVVVLEDIRLAALLALLCLSGGCLAFRVVLLFRIAAVQGLVEFVLELPLGLVLIIVAAVVLIVGSFGGVLLPLCPLLGLADVDNQLLVRLGAVLVDVVVAEAAHHPLEDVLDLGLEVPLVLVAPDNQIGDERGEAGQHELDGETDDAHLDETEAALHDLAVVGRQEESLLTELRPELEEETADGCDGGGDHVRGAPCQTGADHGEVLLDVGRSCGGSLRHVWDLAVVDLGTVCGDHAVSHLDQQLVSCFSGPLIVLLAADNDLAQDGWDEMQGVVVDIWKEGDDGCETFTPGGGGNLLSTGDEEVLELQAPFPECCLADLRAGQARNEFHLADSVESLHDLGLGRYAQECIDGLKDRASALWQCLCVDIEKDSKHVAGESAQMLEVFLGGGAGDSALEEKVFFLLIIDVGDGLIRLHDGSESAADVQSQIDLLVELVKGLGQVQRQIAIAGEDGPNLLHNCLVNLYLHGLGRLAVVENLLEHEFTERDHLALEMVEVGVAGVISEDGEHPSSAVLALDGLDEVQGQYRQNSFGSHGTGGLADEFVCLLLVAERRALADLTYSLSNSQQDGVGSPAQNIEHGTKNGEGLKPSRLVLNSEQGFGCLGNLLKDLFVVYRWLGNHLRGHTVCHEGNQAL